MRNEMITLEHIRDMTNAASSLNDDYTVSTAEFVAMMTGVSKVKSPKGEVVLTPNGLQALVKDRLKLPPALVTDTRFPDGLKLEMIKYAALADPDAPVVVRVNGNMIDTVVSKEYSFFDNNEIAFYLWHMQREGLLPEDLHAYAFHLSPNGREMHVRFMSSEWTYHMNRDGGQGLHYGNFSITNSENATTSFGASVFLTRGLCTNSTFQKEMFKIKHRGGNGHGDSDKIFINALGDAAKMIGEYTSAMFEQLEGTRHIEVQSPVLLFEKVKEEFGIPTYAMKEAKDYWEQEVPPGRPTTVYDAIEALSAGLRSFTRIETTRKEPDWVKRQRFEGVLGNLTTTLLQTHLEGNSVDDWYLTGNTKIKEMIARYVEGYSEKVPEAPRIAAEIRELQLN
jgi:hypothetical protein